MRTTVARRNEMLNTFIANFNSGTLRVYSGTRPTDADTALSGNTLLVTLTLGATAFAAASGGAAVANAITGGTAGNTGTASFARAVKSDGTTVLCDFSVSITGGGGELQFSTLSIVSGVSVTSSGLTLNCPVGA